MNNDYELRVVPPEDFQSEEVEQPALIKEIIKEHGPMYIKGPYEFNPLTGDRVIPSETFQSGIHTIEETSPSADLREYIEQKKAEQKGKNTVMQARELLSNQLLLPEEVERLKQQLEQTNTLEMTIVLGNLMNEIQSKLQNRTKEDAEKAKVEKRITETRSRARRVYDDFLTSYQALTDDQTLHELNSLAISSEDDAINKRISILVQGNSLESDDAFALQVLDTNYENPYNADKFLSPLLKSLGLEGVDPKKLEDAVRRLKPRTETTNIGQSDEEYSCVVDTSENGRTNVYIPRPDGQTYVFLSFNESKIDQPLALTSARVDSRSYVVNSMRGGLVETKMKEIMPEVQLE